MTDKKVVVGAWTDVEKKLMVDVSFEVIDLMKKRLKDTLMIAHCLSIISSSFNERCSIERIICADKNGKILKNYVKRVLGIIEGMQKSDVNLILFRDCSEVWMQYYMGLYFERPTFVIALRVHEKIIKRLMTSSLVKRVEYVATFDEGSISSALKNMKKDMENN